MFDALKKCMPYGKQPMLKESLLQHDPETANHNDAPLPCCAGCYHYLLAAVGSLTLLAVLTTAATAPPTLSNIGATRNLAVQQPAPRADALDRAAAPAPEPHQPVPLDAPTFHGVSPTSELAAKAPAPHDSPLAPAQ